MEKRRKTKSRFRYGTIFLALTLLLSPGSNCGLEDSAGQAVAILDKAIEAKEPSKVPWSGWCWPMGYFPPPLAAEGGPLDKFDQYISGLGLPNPGARSWEAIHHYKPGCSWRRHCHGWAAAAILEPEPTSPGKVGMIDFTVGDLKGLLTEAHCTDAYDLIEGARDIVTMIKDDELKALAFHQVLLDWVSNGEPVVMDRTKKPEVWNHPVYKCQMTTQPDQSDPQKTHATATLWFVSAGVSADFVGTKDFQATYQYWITGDFQNPSDGDWEEGSQIQVRQRAIAAMEKEVGWTQPFRLLFEVVGEEVVEDRPCYQVRVTYPDRPRSAERQCADIWVTKDERAMLKGGLQIGDRSVPMRRHFLTELLKATHLEIDTDGVLRSPLDPRWPDRKVELQAFEGRAPNGGSRVSSLAAPFPLRIDEPTYKVELMDWGV